VDRTASGNVRTVVLEALEELAIAYYVTGSDALTFFGPGRQTVDTDIVVDLAAADYGSRLGPVLRERGVYVADPVAVEGGSVMGQASLGASWVDLVMPPASHWRDACFARRVRLSDPAMGGPIWVISPEDLVIAKLLWARDGQSRRQVEDVVGLLREVNLDHAYLDAAAREFGLAVDLAGARDAAG
jgi:hypothetical protein